MHSTESTALVWTEEIPMTATTTTAHADRYLQPGWFTRNVFNRFMSALAKVGLSFRGSRVLAVRGRTSGEWRTVPVNPLTIDGVTYLVAPRGVTEWVRNIRVAGNGQLRIGRKHRDITVTEITDATVKAPILRTYLHHWKMEVGAFFDGIGPDASDADLQRIAPGYPVFRVTEG